MNTVVELPNQQPEPGLVPAVDLPVDKRDEQIAALQSEIETLKNRHAEDKFLWFLSAIALFNVAALLHVQNWTGPVIIGMIQLIAVAVMADRCKVDLVAPLIDKVTGAFTSRKQ